MTISGWGIYEDGVEDQSSVLIDGQAYAASPEQCRDVFSTVSNMHLCINTTSTAFCKGWGVIDESKQTSNTSF